MQNIIKHIKSTCKKCPEGSDEVVRFLASYGEIPYTAESHREIWHHYKEECKYAKRKEARKRTCEVMNIHRNTLSAIIKKYGK